MSKRRVMVVVGTRPEAVKMAPVVAELRRRHDRFDCILASTGQHREMLRQTMASFGLSVDIDLDIMQPDQTLASLTAAAVTASDNIIQKEKPDIVLVQGDTTTVLAAALAAYYQRVPVGHVEAGLRTKNRYNPFPEEINRSLLGPLATYHFAPTQRAAENLLAEGIDKHSIHVTGNTVVDALQTLRQHLSDEDVSEPVLEAVSASNGRFVLVTCHRRESFGDDLKTIIAALKALANQHPERLFFFPLHLNPNLRKQVLPGLAGIDNIVLSDPVGYADILYCLTHAELLLTDSGGLQEEAPSFGVPAVVLRHTTERPEGVEAGFSQLAPMDTDAITDLASRWLNEGRKNTLKDRQNPYGDGEAAKRIVDVLERELNV